MRGGLSTSNGLHHTSSPRLASAAAIRQERAIAFPVEQKDGGCSLCVSTGEETFVYVDWPSRRNDVSCAGSYCPIKTSPSVVYAVCANIGSMSK